MILLRKLRQEEGLTYEQLEEVTSVSDTTIRNIENRHYKGSNYNLRKLANYFKIKEPLELLRYVTEVIKIKSCLNQRCQLNKECYCQSDQVIAGASCDSQDKISNPLKAVKLNSTERLFIEI